MSIGTWLRQRRTTITSILIGTASFPLALWIAWTAWPSVAPIEPAADRLVHAVELLAGVAAVVLLMVSSCFRVFDTAGAEDPFAGAESPAWRVNQRVLQNTVEQAAIFVPALLALSVRLDPDQVRILPVLTATWCAGRLLFWIGYRIRPSLRGPGFEWTLFSSGVALGWFAWTVVA